MLHKALDMEQEFHILFRSLHPSSYLQAIDVWMGVCTAFVFATLVEFTCVNYLWRKRANPYALTRQWKITQVGHLFWLLYS